MKKILTYAQEQWEKRKTAYCPESDMRTRCQTKEPTEDSRPGLCRQAKDPARKRGKHESGDARLSKGKDFLQKKGQHYMKKCLIRAVEGHTGKKGEGRLAGRGTGGPAIELTFQPEKEKVSRTKGKWRRSGRSLKKKPQRRRKKKGRGKGISLQSRTTDSESSS